MTAYRFVAAAALSAALTHIAITSAAAADAPDAPEPPPPGTAARLLADAPASHWRRPEPKHLLVLQLPTGRVVIELAPQFAPAHVANIQTLAREGYWSGLEVLRAQDNFVVQWGDAGEDIPNAPHKAMGSARSKLPAEFERSSRALQDAGAEFTALPDRDAWAPQVGFVQGFPVARDPAQNLTWLAHCYGMVGAGRDNAPDSSTGAQLYAVIGQAPRALDRNITLVGRVLEGMETLATLKRGPPPMGFYTEPKERTRITWAGLASQLPAAEQPRLDVLRTDSATFAQLNELRRQRKDGWTVRPPGRVDLCGLTVPVRPAPPAAAPAASSARQPNG